MDTGSIIQIIHGDITKLQVDIIVNAAQPSLLGGGGVDGAIHHAAGPRLREACEKIPEFRPGIRCLTGDVHITPGFNLFAPQVFHTVGPVYTELDYVTDAFLYTCYINCLKLANGHASIAFPAISCGAFGCPLERGIEIALKAALSETWDIQKITLVLYDESDYLGALDVLAKVKHMLHK
jgi:O-acetyl-ADP-ribose deacetylase (regulator of RNase III)